MSTPSSFGNGSKMSIELVRPVMASGVDVSSVIHIRSSTWDPNDEAIYVRLIQLPPDISSEFSPLT